MYYFVALTKESTNFPKAKHSTIHYFLDKVLHWHRYPLNSGLYNI